MSVASNLPERFDQNCLWLQTELHIKTQKISIQPFICLSPAVSFLTTVTIEVWRPVILSGSLKTLLGETCILNILGNKCKNSIVYSSYCCYTINH